MARRALEITVDDRGVESALRAFKRLVQRDGILRELRRRQSYEKPGERKRRKVREAARRRRRQLSRALRRMTERG
jgi:small subunit ribosomal protein S21